LRKKNLKTKLEEKLQEENLRKETLGRKNLWKSNSFAIKLIRRC
jgi:hypothetical protein